MALNNYFQNYVASGEQRLIEDLILESIKIYGVDVHYLPRSAVATDELFGEDVLSKFEKSYVIEMYVKNVEGYEGEGDLLSRFGLELRDQMTFTLARRRFTEEVTDVTATIVRPREGDLVWVPFIKGAAEDPVGSLFEIKHVQRENIFYQLGDLQTYDLVVEKFQYSDERLDTGVAEIDQVEVNYSSSYQLQETYLATEAGATLTAENGVEIINDNYDKKLTDKNDDTTFFQDEANFIDFSEINPFSEGTF